MATEQHAIDVDELVDGQKFGKANVNLLFWSFLANFTDGFEISSLGVSAPRISREWSVAPSAMGPMMSASLFGIMVGAPLLGFIGDRYGRRVAISLGCLLFGATTLLSAWAQTVDQLTLLRFWTGIGMGGVMPNTIALNSEQSPRRLRMRLVIFMFMGISLGAATPGLVAVGLVPTQGWQIIFLIGGVIGLLAAVGTWLFLPESVKLLTGFPDRQEELVRRLRALRPGLAIDVGAKFFSSSSGAHGQASMVKLFTNGRLAITLLLWLCFAMIMMANYFLSSWLPVIFERGGLSPEAAALTTTVYQLGAVVGGLVMSFLLERLGFLAVALMLAIAAPSLLAVGISDLSPLLLTLLVGTVGVGVLGAQFGINAGAGIIYPTVYRSKGVGVAFAVGRIGSIAGPIVGAMLIGWKLPAESLMQAAALPLLLSGFSALALALLMRRYFGRWCVEEMPDLPRDSGTMLLRPRSFS